MSLGLWEFFWDSADWIAATPAPVAPTASRSNSGGGHRKYESAPGDFWDVRERYLRRFLEPIEKTAPLPSPSVSEEAPVAPTIVREQALQAAIGAARNAQTVAVLQDAVRRANELALDISNIQHQYYSRAITLLLLDVI